MKMKFLSPFRCRLAGLALLLGFAFFADDSTQAANPVVNPAFDNPFVFGGVTNWSVGYIYGGPGDFCVKGRCTAARNNAAGYGAGFKPWHDSLIHAYFKQTVTNLAPNARYALTSWVNHPGDTSDGHWPKLKVFIESIGGMGSVASDPVSTAGWQSVTVTNRADASGKFEIRLHFDKDQYSVEKWFYIDCWFDDVSLALIDTPPTNVPYKILSFTLTNQTATFKWKTVSNQLYRIQVSPDLSAWTTFQDNLLAAGTNLTFTTNLSVTSPQFFRIARP
jgi:hypothetical protein